MKFYCAPTTFHLVAQQFLSYRWKLLLWSFLLIGLFSLLQGEINSETPSALIWLVLFILLVSLQLLIFSAFIFFFQQLPSQKEAQRSNEHRQFWFKLYQGVEWCEALLFFIILPLPTITFIYALFIT